ncbi:MAG: L-glutamate gamma-semialdehyde dehydrogenase [Acidobacteria bacterium]|nr:L-glutamate gamma-semialdehyde dehydrogenase [Acidobacteriota bacterium]
MPAEFKNEPLMDFNNEENRKKQSDALDQVLSQLGREHDLIIGTEKLKSGASFKSYNPSKKSDVIGTFQSANPEQAIHAIDVAAAAFEKWKRAPVQERANVLFRAAERLRARRFESNAWMILEAGKPWLEADADTAEAIDFCEFYGREALRYAERQPLTRIKSEDNELRYIPLGVGIVIPPWNFPCAILVGMTTASLAAGNTVILKPSSDTPATGAFFMSILQESGLPPGVVNYVTGSGASVGNLLVENPRTRFIAFTGSKEVGLHINETAARTQPGQIWIKRVIAEMGGKDFIIIDEDADLKEALEGVIVSAFGYQGQKCSACSRLIVHEKAYDSFIPMLADKAKGIKVGPATHPSNYMGPVINDKAMQSILRYIDIGKGEGRLVTGGRSLGEEGYFIEPTIFADVDPSATIAREEIFGPVLAVIKAKNFDDAVRIANDSEYGLTGSMYGRNRKHIDRAKDECHAGNFYINKKCTGAMVGVHPFGGFNMSGTDSKAGGRDYLLLFTQAKTVSEKI